jgi:hypothetical protein
MFIKQKTPDGYTLNVVKDLPDIRDRMYKPALIRVKDEIKPPEVWALDQGGEGACTGFGLAAVINLLNRRRDRITRVSPRMLYEMAKKYDQWPGEAYEGSSCRGAIRGWYNMGVCEDELWPYEDNLQDKYLTRVRAKNAQKNPLGAYYRLRHDIVDFHCALNEVGALFVSAIVHAGWAKKSIPVIDDQNPVIPLDQEEWGGHAFAIIGYNKKGFWIQNSWGKDWGKGGVALWTYEDWQKNIKDAWAVRLAVAVPQIRRMSTPDPSSLAARDEMAATGVFRSEIAGHFVHLDDGKYDDHGNYWSNGADIRETASLVSQSDKYDHLLLYAHGGLNSPGDSAKRIRAMKEVFKANRIYSFHFMYDTGLMEELKDVILRKKSMTLDRVGGWTDFSDKLVEKATRHLGRALWGEMKRDARVPFDDNFDGADTVKALVKAVLMANDRLQLHLVGHSNGSVLVGSLLTRLAKEIPGLDIKTLSLLAPACTNDLFFSQYSDPIKGSTDLSIGKATVYNLNDQVEQDDNVAKIYRKSLLYLVSNAFETHREAPLLGLKKFNDQIPVSQYDNHLEFVYSDGRTDGSTRTASTSHGGFDNDPYTMNDILKMVTDQATPARPFTRYDLEY